MDATSSKVEMLSDEVSEAKQAHSPSPRKRSGSSRQRRRARKWFYRALWVMLLLVVAWQGVGAAIAYSFLSSDYHNPPVSETPVDRGLQFKDLVIPVETEPGVSIELSAWLIPADEAAENFQAGAVILMVHGFGGAKGKVWVKEDYRSSLFDQGGESFVQAGFHVVMLDFRNFGASEDFGEITLGHRESEDVAAAVRYIANELSQTGFTIDPNRIGIRAPSMGAATTVLALARNPGLPVKAVWLDSMFATADDAISDFLGHHGFPNLFVPPTKFWMQTLSGASLSDVAPLRCINTIQCPIMIAHSKDDTIIRVDQFYELRDATAGMPNVDTWLLNTQKHHRLWLDPDYRPRQLEFFQKHLAKSPDES